MRPLVTGGAGSIGSRLVRRHRPEDGFDQGLADPLARLRAKRARWEPLQEKAENPR